MIVKSLPEDVYLTAIVANPGLKEFLDGIFNEQIGFCTLFVERCSFPRDKFEKLVNGTYGLTEDGIRYVEVIDVGVDASCVYKLAFGVECLPPMYLYPNDLSILRNNDIVLKYDGIYVDNTRVRYWG